MAKALAVESNRLDSRATKLDSQQAVAFGARIRDRAGELGLTPAEVSRLSGIPKQSMTGYWNGERLCGSDRLFPLSDALQANARWIASGEGPRVGGALVDAVDADFVNLPRYDLDQVTDTGKANRVETVPFRRDWLFRAVRETSGLWLAEAPTGNNHLDIVAGDVLICADVPPGEVPRDHQIYVWRGPAGLLIAQYTILSREAYRGTITPGDVVEGELRPIARVRLKLLAAFDNGAARVNR